MGEKGVFAQSIKTPKNNHRKTEAIKWIRIRQQAL